MATNKLLRSLKGIGDATEAVILEARASKVPDYLAKLEAEPPPFCCCRRCAPGSAARVFTGKFFVPPLEVRFDAIC
jgi:hypothetical protein